MRLLKADFHQVPPWDFQIVIHQVTFIVTLLLWSWGLHPPEEFTGGQRGQKDPPWFRRPNCVNLVWATRIAGGTAGDCEGLNSKTTRATNKGTWSWWIERHSPNPYSWRNSERTFMETLVLQTRIHWDIPNLSSWNFTLSCPVWRGCWPTVQI